MSNVYLHGCISLKKRNTNFMGPFYGWGLTASRLKALRGGSLLFSTKIPETPGTYFIDLGRMKGLSQPWSNPLVLNMGSVD